MVELVMYRWGKYPSRRLMICSARHDTAKPWRSPFGEALVPETLAFAIILLTIRHAVVREYRQIRHPCPVERFINSSCFTKALGTGTDPKVNWLRALEF
jgi:hypothetical protein